ncbi:hypothetical protein EJ110_NYTH50757 [Nymphaea thermarum]|nr:hypothetical protein EJ110_NYTH50757 [Nymphaea thermarum]
MDTVPEVYASSTERATDGSVRLYQMSFLTLAINGCSVTMGRGFMKACVLILVILCLCQREVQGMIMRPSKGRHGMRRESTPVKTIQSEDGDVIDCICIYEQPSLFHPSLMNHEIQWAAMLPDQYDDISTDETNDLARKGGGGRKSIQKAVQTGMAQEREMSKGDDTYC